MRIAAGRNERNHHVAQLAGLLLLKVLLVSVVVGLDIGVGYGDILVGDPRRINGNVLHISNRIIRDVLALGICRGDH